MGTTRLVRSVTSRFRHWTNDNSCLGQVKNAFLKERGADFLRRSNLKQKIRRELSFGLIPTTLKCKKFVQFLSVNHYDLSAGFDQSQDVYNAFEILMNDGFLHDQGVLTLEAVQKFYQEILEEPKEATMAKEKFIDLCRSMESGVHPVVALKLQTLNESQEYYHAVTLRDSKMSWNNFVTITLSDSRRHTGQTTMRIPDSELSNFESGENSVVMNDDEEWCLGDEMCYFLEFK